MSRGGDDHLIGGVAVKRLRQLSRRIAVVRGEGLTRV
jgi:hypothetical protein